MPYIVPDKVREPLYAVVPYFNPWRWKSREKHTLRAIKHFADAGAVVILIEAAFNRRTFSLADSGLHDTPAECATHGPGFRHQYIGLRTKDELWLKENLINVAVSRLPHDWQQVCWLDGDVHFLRDNWVGETIHKLQHYKFLQMFSHARDLGPNNEMLPENYPHADGMSFVQAWKTGVLEHYEKGCKCPPNCTCKCKPDGYPYPPRVWPGLAWAATRQAWDEVGGLFDAAIWGGGDYDMAHALIETASARIHKGVHPNYRTLLVEWENRCKRHIRKNFGLMEGSIIHRWHGKKTERKYVEKRRLMQKVNFDPLKFLKRDYQGLWQLHDDGSDQFVHFRDEMRKISKERNEDSIDT